MLNKSLLKYHLLHILIINSKRCISGEMDEVKTIHQLSSGIKKYVHTHSLNPFYTVWFFDATAMQGISIHPFGVYKRSNNYL